MNRLVTKFASDVHAVQLRYFEEMELPIFLQYNKARETTEACARFEGASAKFTVRRLDGEVIVAVTSDEELDEALHTRID